MKIKTHDAYAEILLKEPKYYTLVDTVHRNIVNFLRKDPPEFFPEYTIHGVDHIENLFKLSLELIDKTTLDKLTPRDTAVLVLSISLHDIGMFITPDGLQKILFSSVKNKSLSDKWDAYIKEIKGYGDDNIKKIFGFDNKITESPREINKRQPEDTKIYGEFIRRHHHELSREIINGFFPGDIDFDIFSGTDYAFDSKTRESDYKKFRSVIGIVSESHGVPIRNTEESLMNLFGDSAYKNPLKIPVFFIMAVLRLADLLDAGEHRASEVLQNSIGIKSLVSMGEWTWNQRINIENYDFVTEHGYLHIDADPESGMEYIKIAEWLKYIQSELDLSWAVISEYYNIGQYNLTVHRIKSSIFDELSKKNYDDKYVTERATFKVMPDLLKLLIQPLYGDNPTYGVRELLQNAVDACNERETLGNYPAGEEGKITVSVDTKAKTFTIEDNGIGMTKDIILNHYLSIGSSYRFSEDYLNKYMEDGKSKVSRSGRFGIGVLAMFLIGRSATIITRSYDEELGYEFTLELEQENIEIRRVECEVGTRVTVNMINNAKEYFQNTYDDRSIFTREIHLSDNINWNLWYYGEIPIIEYYFNSKKLANCNIVEYTKINECMIKLKNKTFTNYKWTYKRSGNVLLCNGFIIPTVSKIALNEFEEYSYSKGLSVTAPFISLKDHNSLVNLNLSRDKCLEIPEKELLYTDILKFIIAQAFSINFHSFKINCVDWYENYCIRLTGCNPKYNVNEIPILFSSRGYSIALTPFLSRINTNRIVVYIKDFYNKKAIIPLNNKSQCYFVIPLDRNIMDINSSQMADFPMKGDMLMRRYFRNEGFAFMTKLVNWCNYTPLINILYHGQIDLIYEKAINSEEYNNTYLFNFDRKYKNEMRYSLNESIPIALEYLVEATQTNSNNLILQLIREYLMETSDDIWIPFDMEERKKKFPKAFRELARFM
jgi:hypothetical protein